MLYTMLILEHSHMLHHSSKHQKKQRFNTRPLYLYSLYIMELID